MEAAAAFADGWRDLAQALDLPMAVADAAFTELDRGYGDPARYYHSKTHIAAMLHHAEAFDFDDPLAVRLAIFFHDVVYDPARNDNEARSAELMTTCLSGAIDSGRLQRAAAMILATAGHKASGDHDTDLMLDLDMGILGQPWLVYETYARGVRAEYLPHTGAEAWKMGRVALFIDPTLASERIFLTEDFAPLEALARDNLRREKAWLSE